MRPAERAWQGGGILVLGRPGRAHSIWHFWNGGPFSTWYVNLEAPWRESALGWDTADHDLDLVLRADGSWRWKDEDDLRESVGRGRFSEREAAEIRAEGERVLAEWPFPTGWEDWRPDPSWLLPTVPDGWLAA